MYILKVTLLQMGFWLTWMLIPLIVEFVPTIRSYFRLLKISRKPDRSIELAFYPTVSLIVPVYNSAATLHACIASIANSNYPIKKLQVILADNQSKDHSFAVYQQAQKDFPQLSMQWLKTAQGKARALNSAIYSCRGDYVINIDSDGILEQDAIVRMVSRFEEDASISAMTGSVLIQEELIKATTSKTLGTLQKVEFLEYAQAFLSGREIESSSNELFTMAGAFSAFRRRVLMKTYLYNVDTVGEDTEMTFQIRERMKGKVVLCRDALFFVDPIEGFDKLYMQRQRWQRGQIEVTQSLAKGRLGFFSLGSDFLVRRLLVDHTFLFLKFIWFFASFSLLFLHYSWIELLLSYGVIYLLYVGMSSLVFHNVSLLLKPFPEVRAFYRSLRGYIVFMPLYSIVLSIVRLNGIINTLFVSAQWNVRPLSVEFQALKHTIKKDVMRFWRRQKKENS